MKNLHLSSLLFTLFALTACGGSDDTEETNASIAPDVTETLGSEKIIDLSNNSGVVSSIESTKASSLEVGQANVSSGQVETATFDWPESSIDIQGNLTFRLAVESDGVMDSVALRWANSDIEYALCEANCGNQFNASVIGLNPLLAGQQPGEVELQVWVGNGTDSVIAGRTFVGWRPFQINNVSVERTETGLQVDWQSNANINRYNVYVASENTLTTQNLLSLEGGQQRLALQSNSAQFDAINSDKDYFVLVTGVEGSGESAWSEIVRVASQQGQVPELPNAQNDTFEVSEDSRIVGNVLENDSPSAELEVQLDQTSQPQNGTLVMEADGTFSYEPVANFFGQDQFTYLVSDAAGQTSSATVLINVLPVNDAPLAVNDVYQLNEQGQVTVGSPGVLANDVDIDDVATELSVQVVDLPQTGSVTLNLDGSFTYQASNQFGTSDRFTYVVSDSEGLSSEAEVVINVAGLNTAPIAQNDQYSVNEDEILVVSEPENGILANDSDPEGDAISIADRLLSITQNGQLVVFDDGTFRYVPNANFFGTDRFSYQILDSQGNTATASVFIEVVAVVDNPIANSDSYQTRSNQILEVTEENGLASNDVNIDDLATEYSIAASGQPQNGSVTIQLNGAFSYTPEADFVGTDTFSYSVLVDGEAVSGATVNIDVRSALNLFDVNVSGIEDTPQSGNVFDLFVGVDTSGYSVVNTGSTDNALGLFSIEANGEYQFTPTLDQSGVVTQSLTFIDEQGLTQTITFTISVSAVNDAPQIQVEEITILEDSGLNSIDLTQFVSDVEGDSLNYEVDSSRVTNNGQLVVSTTGIASYTPDVNFSGTDSFGFRVTDTSNASATATLNITVTNTNDAPNATDITEVLNEDTLLTVDLMTKVSDVDGDSLTFQVVNNQPTSNGVVNVTSDGELTYTPNLNVFGNDSFTYRTFDPQGLSDQGVISFTINPVNDAPVLTGANLGSVLENLADDGYIGTISATDVESDTLSYAIVGGDSGLFNINSDTGVVTLNGSGVLNFELNQSHTIIVQATDNGTPAKTSTQETFTIGVTDVIEAQVPVESDAFGRAFTGYQEFYGDEQTGYFYATEENSGKLYFAGAINNIDKDIYITAYDKDGSFLTSFANEGELLVNLGADEVAKGMVAANGYLYILFERSENEIQELCILHIGDDGDISTSSGENNSGIRCTNEGAKLSAGGITFANNKLYVVGSRDNGTEIDSVFIKYDENSLNFENSTPIFNDVSGANYDDKAYAIANFDADELMVVGATKQGSDEWQPYVRYLESDGTNESNFNAGSDLILSIPDSVGSAEFTSLAAVPTSDFTAYLVGYAENTVDTKDALIVALDKSGTLDSSFGADGISILDLDGDSGAGTASSQITAISRAFIGDQLMLTGTITTGSTSEIIVGKLDTSTATLNPAYGTSGIVAISDSNPITANDLVMDENSVTWVVGGNGSSEVAPFITAIKDDATVFDCFPDDSSDCEMSGKLTLDLSGRERNEIAPAVIEVENGIHTGKYLLLVNTVKPGTGESLVLIQRYMADGSVDNSFGHEGVKQLFISNDTYANGLVEQSDGQLLLFGKSKNTDGDQVGFVARFNQDGTIDSSFGNNGVFDTTSLPDTSDGEIKDIVFNPISSFVTAVAVAESSGMTRPYVIQLTPTGVLDTLSDSYNGSGSHFNTDGYRIEDTDITYTSITLDNANRIVVAGTEETSSVNFWVSRINSDGSKDVSFNGSGERRVTWAAQSDVLHTVMTDNINRVYLLGSSTQFNKQSYVVRLLESGDYDTSFAGNGRLTFDNVSGAGTTSDMFDATFDSQGRIVAVGYGDDGNTFVGGITRINPDGSLDSLFGEAGDGLFLADSCVGDQSFTSLLLNNDSQIVLVNECKLGSDNSVGLSLFDFVEGGVQP